MKKVVKKVVVYTISIAAILSIVLAMHIYLVTRPKAPDEHTKIMARIDLQDHVPNEDSPKISAWLNQQQGIDHALFNPESNIIIFTFYPVKTSADKILQNFKSFFNYKAERIVATANDLKNGCPVASNSPTYKAVKFLKHIF